MWLLIINRPLMEIQLVTLCHNDHLWSGSHICSCDGRWERQRRGLNASSLDEIWCLKQHTDRSPNSLRGDSWASVPNMTLASSVSWQNGRKTSLQTEQSGAEGFLSEWATRVQTGDQCCWPEGGGTSEDVSVNLCQGRDVHLTELTGSQLPSQQPDLKDVKLLLLSHTKVVHRDLCFLFFSFSPVELKAYRKWCKSLWLLFSIVIFGLLEPLVTT